MNSRVNAALVDLDSPVWEVQIKLTLMTTYRLVWEEFCSWYLELIKPPYGEPIDSKTLSETLEIFEKLLKILHPFMPFLTEEVWHWIGEKNTREEALIIAEWPSLGEVDDDLLKNFESLKEIVGGVRNVRKENNIPNKEKLNLKVQAGEVY